MIEKLLSAEVQKFIRDHLSDDPFLLSLNTRAEKDFPLSEAIAQIQSRQKAKHKLPSWLAEENLLFPPPISIEQSSSERTALFKSSLVQGNHLLDLTGGMGVDSSCFASKFERVSYVEPDERLCALARHNFKLLQKNIEVVNQTAESFLEGSSDVFDVIYIDPSRRSGHSKVFRIEDCVPNLYDVIPICLKHSSHVLIKLSPMIDLSLLISELDPDDVWVVAVRNEVKEILCLISGNTGNARIHAVDLQADDDQPIFKFIKSAESSAASAFSLPQKYIYEPNAAILKAGAFKLIGNHYRLKKLHQHTHLYTSDELIHDFPGKIFELTHIAKADKKEIRKRFPDLIVNVITRNYPLSAPQLKKKFGLKDGGDQFLIATTLMNGKKELLICNRID